MTRSRAYPSANPSILFAASGGEVIGFAARILEEGLAAMLGVRPALRRSEQAHSRQILVDLRQGSTADCGRDMAAPGGGGDAQSGRAQADDRFSITRPSGQTIALEGASDRAVLHAVYALLERLGARFPLGRTAEFPCIEFSRLSRLEPYELVPAYARRAFVSDIMTWHYDDPDRLKLHLAHDHEFVPWMAQRGINAFFYIRHPSDSRFKIDELGAAYRDRGIGCEYGGHVLQLLLPRERFATNPEYFPAAADGQRMERGNLCVSSRAALSLVCEGALGYVRENPEIELLHIWGADVRQGTWCRCGQCANFSPQLQYLKVLNAIAEALADEGTAGPPVAYLAYHDTLEPDPGLKPLANLWFEWAPRERCYSHAIDDSACETNPRYLESLKRYIELFEGRGHIFEYYADAVLFGGLGFATPAVIVRDLRVYRALGLSSVSCLTFGAYSVLAYPINLETFVRATRSPDFDPGVTLADVAAERHPACGAAMAQAYRAIERASAMVLRYGDVMRPVMDGQKAARRRAEIVQALDWVRKAIEAAEQVVGAAGAPLVHAERELWKYSLEALSGIAEYLSACDETGAARRLKGEEAINRIGGAFAHVGAIEPAVKGTWGAYDLERLREFWLRSMRRRLDNGHA